MSQQKIKKKSSYLEYIHQFRAIAILFIVGLHVNSSISWKIQDDFSYNFLTVLMDDSTILFVFISGFLFQHLIKKFQFKVYLKKKFNNVIKPYLFFSLPILTIRLLFNKHSSHVVENFPDFLELNPIFKILFYLITGSHLLPYWFIPMVILIFIIAPLLFKLDNNHKLYKYILPITILFSFFIERGGPFETIRSFLHFTPIYMLGMFVSRYKSSVLNLLQKWEYSLFLINITLFILTFMFPSGKMLFIQKLSFTFLMLHLLKSKKIMLSDISKKYLNKIASYSFGIFFLHDYFNVFIRSYTSYVGHGVQGNFLIWILTFFTTVFLSILLLNFLKYIFGKKSREFIGC